MCDSLAAGARFGFVRSLGHVKELLDSVCSEWTERKQNSEEIALPTPRYSLFVWVLGLLNPILVRRKGDKYEVISGHRRLAAYRRLQFAAKSDKDRKKYAAIPARELASVTGEQMILLGLTENLLRADISPLDAALGLQALKKLRPALNTAKKLSETTGLLNKVSRLLRLADSPEVVQQGVRDGLAADASDKKDAARRMTEPRNILTRST